VRLGQSNYVEPDSNKCSTYSFRRNTRKLYSYIDKGLFAKEGMIDMGKYRLLFKEDNGEFLQVSLHYEGIDDNTIDVYQFAAYDDILSSVEDCLTGFMNDLSDANIVLSPMQQSYIRKKLREKFSEYAEKHLAEKSSAEAVVDQSPKTRYSYAIGHSIENGPQKKNNKQRIDEFKHLSKEDRSNILLAIPSFFDSIEFTKKEINMIANRLCI